MSVVIFAGAQVVLDGSLERADLVVDDGRITEITREGTPSDGTAERGVPIDCRNLIIAPGFIDLQCNGANGVDLTSEPSGIEFVARQLPRFGVTAFLPTIVTCPATVRHDAIAALPRAVAGVAGQSTGDGCAIGATPLGLHLEGPMISLGHLGAHPASHVALVPDAEIAGWIDSGCVRMVTLAPERRQACAIVERLVAGNIVASAGHTAMSPVDFDAARGAGLSYVTHLFNAMAPFTHRSPGPVGAVLADDAVVVGLICDGIHVDPVAVRMAWNSLGPSRTSLVSDASAALGAPFGRFRLGEFGVSYDETGVRTSDGALAGSALPLDRAVRNLISYTSCDIVDAVATVTSTPADLLGLTDRGRLRVGCRADLTILDGDANLVGTVIAGRLAWRANSVDGLADRKGLTGWKS